MGMFVGSQTKNGLLTLELDSGKNLKNCLHEIATCNNYLNIQGQYALLKLFTIRWASLKFFSSAHICFLSLPSYLNSLLPHTVP